DPLQKVTIVPRGGAGGYVWRVSDKDRVLINRSYFLDNIAVALGGRVAEELVFKEISSGASSDIQQLTSTARAMVTKYGMSPSMGPLQFGQQDEMVFLGRDLAEQRDYSEEVAEQIDDEVKQIVDNAYKRVRELLQNNLDKLHAVAKALLERETLNHDEFEEIFQAV
ncbi:MAG: cell division protein FtsH, partial [Caldilineaceae bacterium]|nr:cell division protein FtsH [Caldilineaceae bacterium]